ncbi:hypothetical protein ACFQFC_36320 [Amorphoplanes digitatis]|uniref:Uncharacterized protein n=1 Tax=Actinoplanes digitatis TaxID=1868 RepID=A0A7W7HVL1_9ACTN|nr:hypothetical protein [Actinoplanes digitatis]MBB4761626.1 hypothetical protein [Actinoplanes digitatis]
MTASKRHLPYPYDQDLIGIVTRVKGKRPATRAALPNDLKVASYLKAGVTLIERNLGPQDGSGDLEQGVNRPYRSGIKFLTERAVIAEMERIEPPFLRLKGDGPYRCTWATHDDYVDDLLDFLFHPINYDDQYGAAMQTRGESLINAETLVDASDHVAFYELQAICRMSLFRLQLMMAATARHDDGIHRAIARNYTAALEPWKKYYESTIAERGFRLCEGVSLDQFANMLAAVIEGFAVRHLGDPEAGILGDAPTTGSTTSMLIIAVLNSYLEPANGPRRPALREQFAAVENAARGRQVAPCQGRYEPAVAGPGSPAR